MNYFLNFFAPLKIKSESVSFENTNQRCSFTFIAWFFRKHVVFILCIYISMHVHDPYDRKLANSCEHDYFMIIPYTVHSRNE